jgi:hypothetical protein
MYETALVVFQILIVCAVLQDVIGRRFFNWSYRQLDKNIHTLFAIGGLLLVFRIGIIWGLVSLVTATVSFLVRVLVQKLFRKKRTVKPLDEKADENEPEMLNAEVAVPEKINPKGLYAIFFLQAEMYDLGNKQFIGHYLIYDERKQNAVDVTAHIRQAPLLSAVPKGKVLDDCSDIRALLYKKRIPQYTNNQGVKKFIALELASPVSEQIRNSLAALVDLDKTREVALNQFAQNLGAVRDVFFSNPRVNPQDDTMVNPADFGAGSLHPLL